MDCLSKITNLYRNKKVLILGLGIQDGGVEAALFFAKLGCDLRVSDLKSETILSPAITKLAGVKNVQFEFGQHSAEFIRWADLIVRNPGVPLQSEALQLARSLNKTIIMPSAFLAKHCQLQTIGITGTRGKSTTTNIIFQILQKEWQNQVGLAGNIPQHSPFKTITNDKINKVVMELSSWELQGFREYQISPQIAVLTNIYPDHLNYYHSMDDYIADKLVILEFQKPSDHFITLKSTYDQYPQIAKLVKGELHLVDDNYYQGQFAHLIGSHNRRNGSLALKVAEIMGIKPERANQVISQFAGLPFRLEYLGELQKAPVYNDSTSTTPIAGITALAALTERFKGQSIISLVGGNDKQLPVEEWIKAVNQQSAMIYLLPGTFSERVFPHLDQTKTVQVPDFDSFFSAVSSQLTPQHIILFSPAATSFATFKNEFDRGRQFTEAYQRFKAEHAQTS